MEETFYYTEEQLIKYGQESYKRAVMNTVGLPPLPEPTTIFSRDKMIEVIAKALDEFDPTENDTTDCAKYVMSKLDSILKSGLPEKKVEIKHNKICTNKCPNCDVVVDSWDKFCPNCGSKITWIS